MQFPWHGDAAGKIPLTGTLFEYLDARNARGDPAPAPNPETARLLRGEARKLASDLPADQRDWGYWRHYDEISQARRHSGLTEYFEQIGHLTAFFDRLHRPGERGCAYVAPDLEDFRKTLTRDLADVLGISGTRRAFSSLKGLEAYDVGDTGIFAGRSRSIDKIFREIERQDASDQDATGALIVGASGAGNLPCCAPVWSARRPAVLATPSNARFARSWSRRRNWARLIPSRHLRGHLADPGESTESARARLQLILQANRGGAPELLAARVEVACVAAAGAEQTRSRFGLAHRAPHHRDRPDRSVCGVGYRSRDFSAPLFDLSRAPGVASSGSSAPSPTRASNAGIGFPANIALFSPTGRSETRTGRR